MSYILDALKKSDQQRQRGETPTLRTSQAIDVPPPARRAWLYPALALAVAAIAFALGALRPWHTEPIVVAAPGTPAVAPAVVTPAAPPAIVSSPQVSPALPSATAPATASTDAPKIVPAEPPRVALARTRALDTPAAGPERAAEKPTAQKSAAPQNSPTIKEEKPADDKVPALSDLPGGLRSELPSMNITVHAFSRTPKDRLVGVNDKLLREGDTLTPDLVLERITPDGMIFSYKGTRFHRSVR